ncbi:HlyD family type I secretion periplasmic adaptor subunit [Fuscovulum blasticum]|uniref:HlyD family type I secretion periplasmic adaptor subunit n=1 Tax=Fuscovulum blasticum TaxID=1075 RepID=UPI000D3EAB69|nr:HlyD family type I secretion periplasmic adaptor subunit [Fuscovulum blasticum]AWD21720.1 RTX toxin [Fuscovulum blasticum]
MTPAFCSARRPVMLGLATLAGLAVAALLWGSLAPISGAIVASGRVEVAQNRQVVQHPDGGVVAEIRVTDGAHVAAGDVLVRLDGSALSSDLAIVQGRLTELSARRARLVAERDAAAAPVFPPALLAEAASRPEVAEQVDGQRRLFAARAESLAAETGQLRREIDQIRAQIDGIAAQSDALVVQLALIRQELAAQQALQAKGLAQAATVLALQREEARLAGQAGELAAVQAQARARITETEIRITRLTADRREAAMAELRDIAPTEMELAERARALTDRLARLDLRAPVSGVVLGLAVTTPRAVLRPAEPVLFLVPQNRPLLIAAAVSPLQVAGVRPGQPAELAFPALAAPGTPHLTGRVTLVSADALADPATHAAYYRVEIAPDPGQIDRLAGQALVPGMPVQAYLSTGPRSPFGWLVQPLTDAFAGALREG